MKKLRLLFFGMVVAGAAWANDGSGTWLRGTTDRDPLSYKPGDEMVITLTPMNVTDQLTSGEYFLDWKRSDDFGGVETGRVAFTGSPFVYRTKLDRPGFVRLQAAVVDKAGQKYQKKFTGDATTPEGRAAMNAFEKAPKSVFFDGGAGVEPEKLVSHPEPKDFDQFWARQYARLDRVPVKADLIEMPSANGFRSYAVRIDCAGLRPVTGYLFVPRAVDEGKTFPCRLETHGYSGKQCVHGKPSRDNASEIILNINAHGLKLVEFGATEADTKALRWEIGSNGNEYAFDEKQNADPEVAYFNGMVLRVKRALQYLKTVKGWNGKDLIASGGSQGGLQTIWAAGCGEGVTRAESCITWCCDMARNNLRREGKASTDWWYIPWTESMGYYDAVNFAKRIPLSCRTVITRAGLGDYCCPPMGLAKLYNNIPGNKEIRWVQGSQHGYEPPDYPGRDFRRSADVARIGFWRIERHEGRDWFVDPSGRPTVLCGVDHVRPEGWYCEALKYAPYGKFVQEHYPSREAWAQETAERLKGWGFNMLGGEAIPIMRGKGFARTAFVTFSDPLCVRKEDPDKRIREYTFAPGSAFPNVFHPDFAAFCERRAAERCAGQKDDPELVGYFLDNELAWAGDGSGLFDTVEKLPDVHSAKRALKRFVAGRTVTPALKDAFVEFVAERYFSVTRAAILKADPNHLILGCRYAGLGGAPKIVWQVGARYSDAVTFNCYPTADLDRNVVIFGRDGETLYHRLDAFAKELGKPLLITEWGYSALDAGLPCCFGAGQRFRTQRERAQAAELCARTLLSLPSVIGYSFFCWADEPALGQSRANPEDTNYGLVNERNEPYALLVDALTRVQSDREGAHRAKMPEVRPAPPGNSASERDRFLSSGGSDDTRIRFSNNEGLWRLSNGNGIELVGKVGNWKFVDEIRLDGKSVGGFSGLIETSGASRHWIDTKCLRDVQFERKNGFGSVLLTGDGELGDIRFRMTLKLTVSSARNDVLAEIVSVENVGPGDFTLARPYMRPFAAGKPTAVPSVPRLWKGGCAAYWRLEDGRRYGVESTDSTADVFKVYTDAHGWQHPDIMFCEREAFVLHPGEKYSPATPLSARICLTR